MSFSATPGHLYANPGHADSTTVPLRRQHDGSEDTPSHGHASQLHHQQHPYAAHQTPHKEYSSSQYHEQPSYSSRQLYRDPYDYASSASMIQHSSDSGYGQRESPYGSTLAPTTSTSSTLAPKTYTYGGVIKSEHDHSIREPSSILQDATLSNGITPRKRQRRVYKTALGDFSWKDLLKRKFWKYYILLLVLSVLVALATIYHDDIIKWLQPVSERIRDIPAGWTIWVGIMFVISFPPLFGHEVVCLLCGLIYGLWIGFAIVCLGTMLGEWGNFFVFKYWCSARAKKMEEKDITFACIARVIREGGFMIPFMARLSAIPGHLTTPAFAATGMGLLIFSITAIVTLPKQLMAVYLGTVFGQEKPAGFTTQKAVEWSVLGASFLITIWAAYYIYAKMAKVRPIVVAEIESRQAAAEALADGTLPHIERAQSPTVQTSLLHSASLRRQQQQIDEYAPRHSNPANNVEKTRTRWSSLGQQPRSTEMQVQDSSKQPFALAGAEQAGFHDPARLAARSQDVHPYASPQGGSHYATPIASPSVSDDDFAAGRLQQHSDYSQLADRSPAAQSTLSRNRADVQGSQPPMHMYEMQEVRNQPASRLYPGPDAPHFPEFANSRDTRAQPRPSGQEREASETIQYYTPQGNQDDQYQQYQELHGAAYARASTGHAVSDANQPVRYQLRDE